MREWNEEAQTLGRGKKDRTSSQHLRPSKLKKLPTKYPSTIVCNRQDGERKQQQQQVEKCSILTLDFVGVGLIALRHGDGKKRWWTSKKKKLQTCSGERSKWRIWGCAKFANWILHIAHRVSSLTEWWPSTLPTNESQKSHFFLKVCSWALLSERDK